MQLQGYKSIQVSREIPETPTMLTGRCAALLLKSPLQSAGSNCGPHSFLWEKLYSSGLLEVTMSMAPNRNEKGHGTHAQAEEARAGTL